MCAGENSISLGEKKVENEKQDDPLVGMWAAMDYYGGLGARWLAGLSENEMPWSNSQACSGGT